MYCPGAHVTNVRMLKQIRNFRHLPGGTAKVLPAAVILVSLMIEATEASQILIACVVTSAYNTPRSALVKAFEDM